MVHFQSDFLHIMEERGFLYQISHKEELDKHFKQFPVTAYIGFDPTAPSLHVGSLIQIMMLHWLQETGHRPIVLMGGGTGMIGDPSFKNEARKLLSVDTIQQNIAGIKTVFSRYICFQETGGNALILNNADWLHPLNYLEFLRDVGRHFSVNRMLSFDSVKTRLDTNASLSFLEFNYMLLQAYDFVALNQQYDVSLQMGGADQWGNIVNGIELGHRMGTKQLYGLTSPLLTTSSGAKMGKSLNGAIWLNSDMLNAYEFWQYWRNSEDADLVRFLKLYTKLPLTEINRLAELQGSELNEVKKILATEVTTMLHGRDAALQAAETARKTFEEGQAGSDLPTIYIEKAKLVSGCGLLTLLVQAGLVHSNSEARRSIKAGGIRLNDQNIDDEAMIIHEKDLNHDGFLKLSLGKKKHVLVRIKAEPSS